MLLFLLLPTLAHAFTLESFSPENLVKEPRQARAVFSEAVVSFGDPRAPAPYEVQCSAKGKGLWEDSRTWIYEFEENLSSGERCAFKPRANLKSAQGGSWENPRAQEFHTGAPAIKISMPDEGGSVTERPAFFLALEGPVDPKSVEENAYLIVEGLSERVPLKLLPEKLREEIGQQNWDYRQNKKKYFAIALESTRVLPAGKKLKFVWGKGIRSTTGLAQEQDHFIEYMVEAPFRAEFTCSRENPKAPCTPVGAMYLSFNSEITSKEAGKIFLKGKNGNITPTLGKEETLSSLSFKGPFPPREKFSLVLPKGFKDTGGRALSNAKKFPLEISTAGFPPLAKFSAPFGILEARDPVLPVTLRNVEAQFGGAKINGVKAKIDSSNPASVIAWIRKLYGKEENYVTYVDGGKNIDRRGQSLVESAKGAEKFEMPKPNGAEAFEVIGIPLEKKGFHVVELKSQLLGNSLLESKTPTYVATGALVTDMAAHLKWGVENSLVWVTSLDKAAPVAGAKVKVTDCAGKILWEGKSGSDGTAETSSLPGYESVARCEGEDYKFSTGIFVFAEKGDDFTFAHSGWDDGIEPWRFQVAFSSEEHESLAHTIFDRTLLRAGQTVHMRHLLREKYMRGLRLPGMLPKKLEIQPPSGEKITLALSFNGSGSAESEWKIPATAPLGTYYISLVGEGGENARTISAGSFRVEEFRLPVMSGTLQWPKAPLIAAKSVPVDITMRYLSGGGAAGLGMKLRGQAAKLSSLSFEAFDGFVFANGGVKPGRERRSYSEESESKAVTLTEQKIELDAGGAARSSLEGIPLWDQTALVTAEAEYRDPNGEVQTLSQSTKIFPSAVLVGLKRDGWTSQQTDVKFTAAAADPSGKPLAGRDIKVRWAEKKTFSHRKRIVGGFYAYESFEETALLGEACSGKTDEKGLLLCNGKAPASGNLVLVAEAEDGAKKSRANQEIWVASGEDWWFSAENNDRIDFLPEKKRYEPGETAHFQVRMPFREATALVTVEREGVIDHFVQQIDGKKPVIEIPVKEFYAPNVFISALLVRGRTEDPKATALVDLAKPAHKLGLGEIQVGWKAHELKVAVSSDREEYRVREKAKVKIHVTRALDGKAPEKGTVTLAVVDEALLELKQNASWDVLDAMMETRSLHVRTSTAQSQVVGKRHFGLKALPAGGGGGRSTRELFDTLLLWKGTLPLDRNGDAEVEVPMNDSLSSFRIVAIATEGLDRFGRGDRSVRTRQDLMLFSGVSPLARYGDKTFPEVTVRNASNAAMKVEVKGKIDGKDSLAVQSLQLAAGASQVVRWPFTIGEQGDSLSYEIEASSGENRDAVKITQKLEPAWRTTTVQGTLEQIEKEFRLPMESPAGMVPETGSVFVRMEKSLAKNLDALEEYMDLYPYNCLEQQVSRAVALRDGERWAGIQKSLSGYIDSQGLLKFFPESLYGSDTLSSYVLSISQEAGFKIGEEQIGRLVEGLQNFVNGKTYSAGFIYPAADLAVRKLAAMEALSRYQSFDPKMLSVIQIEPELWPLRAKIDWWNLLEREKNIPGRDKKIAQVEQLLRAEIQWRGTVVGFRSETPLWWLMNSADVDANRLLLSAQGNPSWAGEVGRLVRGVLARQKRGAWDLTTANAWGRLAIESFSQKFEKEEVKGVTKFAYGKLAKQMAWAPKVLNGSVEFPAQKGKVELVVQQQGGGKPWALIESRAALRLKDPIFKGYRAERTVVAVLKKKRSLWSVGDIYRVRLTIDAPSDMTWVAVTDPIPAGATILGSGLGRDSSAATVGEAYSGAAITERSFAFFRSYFDWMPKGKHVVEYTVRLNTAGTFLLPNSRVEAMYAPEMFAEMPNAAFSIVP